MENIKNQISEILSREDVGIFSMQAKRISQNTWERLGRFCHEKYEIDDIFCVTAPMLES